MKRSIIGIFVVGYALAGCGGSSSSTSVVPLAQASVDHSTIQFGDAVQLSAKMASPVTANFNLFGTLEFVGPTSYGDTPFTVVDHPAITTTYLLTARDAISGDMQVSRLTVKVAKTSKRYLIVGDSASAETLLAQAHVAELSSVAPVVSVDMPSDLTAYDATILLPTGHISPANQSAVQAALTASKGVILVGESVTLLATGQPKNSDLTSISPWLGSSAAMWSIGTSVQYGPSKISAIASDQMNFSWDNNAMKLWSDVHSLPYSALGNPTSFLYVKQPTIGGKCAFFTALKEQSSNGVLPANGAAWDYIVKSYMQWAAH